MNRIFSILLLWTSALGLWTANGAELPVATNSTFARFASSYFTSHRTGDYLDSAKYLYWPNQHIYCYEDSRGGAGIQDVNENRLERKGIAQWANGKQFWGELWADDNGGYTTNQVVTNSLNTFSAPTNLFNGAIYTNEGGWCATNAIGWLGFGAIPYTNQLTIGCAEDTRNNAETNVANLFAYQAIDIFHALISAGWSNDIASGTNKLRFGVPDLTHPGPPGNLGMAIVAAQAEMDTNVNTCILNFMAGIVAMTNHCVVSSAANLGNNLTFNWLANRHSMAWDVAGTVLSDGNTVTNDASDAFTVTPAFSNAFYEVMTFTNVPNGSYSFSEDGQVIWTGTVSGGRLDINLFNITTGPNWNQRVEVLRLIRLKRYCNEITLADGSAGDGQGEVAYDSAATTQWNAGKRGDALIAALAPQISNLNSKDSAIWTAAASTNNAFALTLLTTRYAPFHR